MDTLHTNMNLIPKKIFFTKGVGRHNECLESIELAFRDAMIETYNLVTVSSILPPNCIIVKKEDCIEELNPGQIVFCVMSKISSDELGKTLTSSIGCAIPKDMNMHGYLSEHHEIGMDELDAGVYVEKLARSMYVSRSNIEPIKTMHITKSAIVKKDFKWTTVVSAAIFII